MANLSPLFLNNAIGTVQAGSSAIGSATATGINVASGEGAAFGTIGSKQFIPAVIVDTSTTPETVKEYVWVTARTADALTVVRQAEDSATYAATTSSVQAGFTIAAVASKGALELWSPHTSGYYRARDFGYITMNTAPLNSASAGMGQPTAGRIYIVRVPMPTTALVTNVVVYTAFAGSTLTASQNYAGIYDSSGNLLVSTGDQSAAWTATGLTTMALSSPTAIVGGPDQYVYVAMVSNGSTRPQFLIGGSANASAPLALVNATATASTAFAALAPGTGQTSLPATLTLSSNDTSSGKLFWAALS